MEANEKILQISLQMFFRYGIKHVTMDDIANEMGISKKTIYQHFANKNDLVEAVTMQMFETISCGIDQICQPDKNAIEELFEIKDFVLHKLKDEKASPIFQLQKYFPRIYKTLHGKEYCKMQDCVITNLKKGVETGLYRPEIDIEFISKIYYSCVHALKDKAVFSRQFAALVNAGVPIVRSLGVLGEQCGNPKLKKALMEFKGNSTDESQAVEALGLKPKVFKGNPLNFKVTFAEDLIRAEKSLEILGKKNDI